LAFAIAQLRRLKVPAVLLPGNYDRPEPRSAYPYAELAAHSPGAWVFLRPEPEAFEFPDLDLVVYGRAGSPDPRISPLTDLERRPGFSFHSTMPSAPMTTSGSPWRESCSKSWRGSARSYLTCQRRCAELLADEGRIRER